MAAVSTRPRILGVSRMSSDQVSPEMSASVSMNVISVPPATEHSGSEVALFPDGLRFPTLEREICRAGRESENCKETAFFVCNLVAGRVGCALSGGFCAQFAL